jgi:hypothetical protein
MSAEEHAYVQKKEGDENFEGLHLGVKLPQWKGNPETRVHTSQHGNISVPEAEARGIIPKIQRR